MSETLGEILERISTPEFLQHFAQERAAATAVNQAQTMTERWDALRRLYEIVDTTQHQGYPGGVDWVGIFTPIEFSVWQDIRHYGLPLWPQYPACGVFFDFADPHKKIAVEADGKDWHDEEKDRARDERVSAHGWQVYRVPGKDCLLTEVPLLEMMENFDHIEHPSKFNYEFEKFKFKSSAALISAIKVYYYGGQSGLLSLGDAEEVLEYRSLVGGPSDPMMEDFD